ncbi:hypothetical protein [Pedobacter cryotolerans]|uniref:Uncharacterized protein n=1 Tax=Pedobacter cryotolerans TaxID=2571270 RepID=A0A4U1CA26_9SPHI|nr:hypothetical protein [Pedobacter cryotolerans]TKC03303.1 hypothetical protein FA045_01665 [Pedobacter cryotolerans]
MPTEKIYHLSGHKLLVVFRDQLIQIKHPHYLKEFLSSDIKNRSEVLVNYIKQDYFLLFAKELNVSNKSLIIEIWAHVFASYFARAMKKLIKLKLIERVANFIIKRSDIIDCGESNLDSNRKLWDVLANFKGIILFFLPKRIKQS